MESQEGKRHVRCRLDRPASLGYASLGMAGAVMVWVGGVRTGRQRMEWPFAFGSREAGRVRHRKDSRGRAGGVTYRLSRLGLAAQARSGDGESRY
jgi:hypothetical protein